MGKIGPVAADVAQASNHALDAFIETLRSQRTTALDAVAELAAKLAEMQVALAAKDKEITALRENIALKDQVIAKAKGKK